MRLLADSFILGGCLAILWLAGVTLAREIGRQIRKGQHR